MIFVTGLSGSGKSVAAARSGVLPIVPLDSYFHDDHPRLPKWFGRTDWETIESYDLDAAAAAVVALARGADVVIPTYDHQRDARVGQQTVNAAQSFVAEGVYAPEVYELAATAGVTGTLVHIAVPARTAFMARLRRDVRDRNMNPIWAVVRSIRLALRHARYRDSVIARGAELQNRAAAPRRIAELALRTTQS